MQGRDVAGGRQWCYGMSALVCPPPVGCLKLTRDALVEVEAVRPLTPRFFVFLPTLRLQYDICGWSQNHILKWRMVSKGATVTVKTKKVFPPPLIRNNKQFNLLVSAQDVGKGRASFWQAVRDGTVARL